MEILKDNKELYKGIFWIVDQDDLENNKNYCFQIPVNSDGDIISNDFISNAKSGTTYNHKNTWNSLSSKLTKNKSFDYFPRGRVEINNGKAIIWVNPNLYNEEVKKFIIDEFNLNKHNNIKEVVMKADFSAHYKCYLDN